MRKLFAILIAVGLLAAMAAQALPTNSPPFQVKLAWDASTNAGVTYMLYLSNSPAMYTNVPAGTNLTASLTRIAAGRWTAFATARLGELESEPSNVILFEVPNPPAAFRVTLMGSTNLTAPGSNLGFFWIQYP